MNTSENITFKKVKIVVLISFLPKQGPVQVVFDTIKNIDFSIFDVSIVTFKKEYKNSIMEHFENLPIKIVKLNETGKLNILNSYQELKIFVINNQIEIVHSHCFTSLLLNKFLKNVKSVHTIHIYPGLQNVAMKGYLIGNIMNAFTKWLIKQIQTPIACSESVRDALQIEDAIKVGCIQNGVSSLVKPDISKHDLKKNLNLDPNFKYFISVGRFSKEKNFTFLVEHFMKLNLIGCKLIILGEGILYNQVASVVDESVILPGFKHNVSDYLFASDYYISSSLTEGMPLSVLEAMSAGLPILLSNIQPHKEIFKKTGNKEIGFTYNFDNETDFENKTNKLLTKDYSFLQENVIAIYNDWFSAEKMSKEYQKQYLSLTNKKYD